MKKIKFIILYLLFFVFVVSAKKSISDISTILVIIEERENDVILTDETPVAEGIFETLWENQNIIFFDLKVDSPIKFNDNNLDAKPFIEDAKNSGADSILLIKIEYIIEQKKDGNTLKVKEYYYNLYSIDDLESLKIGKNPLNINKKIDVREKKEILKQIGIQIINEVYK